MPRAKPLIETSGKTIRAEQNKAHCHSLPNVKIAAISFTLGEIEGRQVVYTLGDVEAEEVIDTLHNTPPKANAEGLGDTV